jgi:alpha-soluble NSF attachment protein
MNMAKINRAEELIKKGDKIMSKFFYLGDRYEDAKQLYFQASNLYKIKKEYIKSAQCIYKIIHCLEKIGDSKYEIACSYNDLALLFEKDGDIDSEINALEDAAVLFTELGNFNRSAKTKEQMGVVYEKDGENEKALKYFTMACDDYELTNSITSQIKIQSKMGHVHAMMKKYRKAIYEFDKCLDGVVDDKLLRYGSKNYSFKAMICYICLNKNNLTEQLEHYCDVDTSFENSYEHKFLVGLMAASNIEELTLVIKDFDSFQKLDSWMVSMLLRVKNSFQAKNNLYLHDDYGSDGSDGSGGSGGSMDPYDLR